MNSRELLPYVLAFGLLETAVVEFSFLAPASDELGTSQFLLASLSIAITAIGLLYVYRANGSANGEHLLERLLVLGWVAGIRYSVLMLLLLVIFGALASFSDIAGQLYESAFGPFFALALGLYYAYLGRHVASVANGSQGRSAA